MFIPNPTARIGEELATKYLKSKGYKIIERNFRKGYGEIDIIATKNNVLVFVEVKTKTSNYKGTPLEQIHYYKLQNIIKTAQFYKLLNPKLPESMRIDAISVMLDYSGKLNKIEHIENISGF